MKISWGVGITITIVVFTVISLSFVYFAIGQDINLVREDYYEAEVQFNELTKTIERTKNLDEKLNVLFSEKKIKLLFPKQFAFNNISGTILLYRPSNRALDLSKNILLDSNNTQYIDSDNLKTGMWKVQVNWMADSLSYFNEEIIMVP